MCSDISDHFPVFVIYEGIHDTVQMNGKSVKYRLMNDVNLSRMCNFLENSNFDYCDSSEDINLTFDRFYNHLFSAFADSCPVKVKTLSSKRLLKPWIDQSLLFDIKRRQKYFIQYKQGIISKQFFTRFRI